MAEPCFAWTAGTKTRLRTGDTTQCEPSLTVVDPQPARSWQADVDGRLCGHDVGWYGSALPPLDVIPAVMAEPCCAWTAGTHASIHKRDTCVRTGDLDA